MKRCPECRRDYYDDTLLYCLDDGNALLEGPASMDEPATAILSDRAAAGGGQSARENATRPFIHSTEAEEPRGEVGSRRRQLAVFAAVALILVAGFFGYRYFKPAVTEQINSIAVLPFENRSGSADAEYLSDGLSDSLIYRLTHLPNLKVSPTSSVIRYKGQPADVAEIAKALEVDAVMSGKLAQRGDDLTISVELTDARTNKLIWAEQYNRKMSDLLATQHEIATAITQKLQLKLAGDQATGMTKKYTDSNEAYQLYLQGHSYWEKRGPRNIEIAIGFYNQAIAVDPNYALAYAGLAEAYAQPSQQPQGFPKSRAAALTALSLDNNLAEAHIVFGRLLAIFDYDLAGAEREVRRAIELNPNYAPAHQRYGGLLTWQGHFEAAEAEYRRALELEPLSLVFNYSYGTMMIEARRYEAAITQLKKTLELDDKFLLPRPALARAYAQKGDYRESIEVLAQDAERDGNVARAAAIRESFAKGGWEGYLRDQVSKFQPVTDTRFLTVHLGRATIYAQLGEKEKAIAELNAAYENHERDLPGIKVNPQLDPLRNDPRFQELLKKVGFP